MNPQIRPLDFYLLRVPALPVSSLYALHAHQNRPDFVAGLRGLYQATHLQEAIHLASPELHQALLKWLAKPAAADEPTDQRLVLTLYKYILRMSSRCTPYGLFAGVSMGHIGPGASQLTLEDEARRYHQHRRLDMNCAAELSGQVAAEPPVKHQLKVVVNSSLYLVNGAYRYYKYHLKHKRRYYYLVSCTASPHLQQVLDAARQGATYQDVVQALIAAGAAAGPAAQFLDRLLAAQLLLTELEPTVTGPEFYEGFVARVAALAPVSPTLGSLRAITNLLGASSSPHQAVQDVIRETLPAATSKELIQTDLRLALTHNTLNESAVALLSQDLSELAVLNTMAVPASLQQFAAQFQARYEDQEIPLLEALDAESGIGYGAATAAKSNYTPLIDGLRLPARETNPDVAWTPYRQLVFRKFWESQQQEQPTVCLTEAELAALAPAGPVTLPATLYALGSLVAASPAALDRGQFRFQLATCTGPGAMSLLARFAHAEPALASRLAACGQLEQAAAGPVLLAEVVHLPEARVGNILQRPQLRAYEIPFLGTASVAADRQLPVSDLFVSVRQGRVVLRSARLDREILPRLTTAHNYDKGIPVYRFLCDMQHQAAPFRLGWDWGVLHQQPFLPRIEYKRVIVSRARWYLPADTYAQVAAIEGADQLAAFRQRHRLPQQVLLQEGDNELLLDFDCPLALDLLRQRLQKGAAVLVEFVHELRSGLVMDAQQQPYVNEVIIPLASTSAAAQTTEAAVARPAVATPSLQRTFAPGSEWTYLKVYCGARQTERILTDYLLPCINALEAQQPIRKWFFIRYADPEPHLRLRFLHDGCPTTVAAIMQAVHQALEELQQQRVVQTIQYDTYQREIERYGATTMLLSEAVFYADSRAVLSFLSRLAGEEGEQHRWLFALRGADELMTDFGLSLPQKAALAEQLRQRFFEEFRGNASLTRQLNDAYRGVSRLLTGFLVSEGVGAVYSEAEAVLKERSVALRAFYQEYEATGAGPLPTEKLLPSYLHMFLNRVFIANQRLHELVVYHYLTKYYASALARSAPLPAPLLAV